MFTWSTYRSIAKAILTKRSPYYIQFYIIGKCNLKCRQCNIVETNSRITELTLEEIEKVAKNLRSIGAGIVLLTGGEPFMRCDLPEIVAIFVKNGLNVRLQTAGTKYATEEKLLACYRAGARDINVSLDSLDFRTSDYINAVPGSGRNAVETIERISSVFRNESAILSFGTVLSKFNYKEIPSILQFAKDIGWYVSLVPVHIAPTDTPKGFRSYDHLFRFTPDLFPQLDILAEKLIELKKIGMPLFDADHFIRSSMSFLRGKGPTWRHNGVCDSPNLYFAIRPNGDFTTCCDYVLKDPPKVYDQTFVADYKSNKVQARNDVQSIVKNCSGCHYGSYPEVTLSVRDPKTFIERTLITLKSGKNTLKNSKVQSNFVEHIETLKSSNPDVYPIETWMAPNLFAKVSQWNDPAGRREILNDDNEARKLEGRVRGVGPDMPIEQENNE